MLSSNGSRRSAFGSQAAVVEVYQFFASEPAHRQPHCRQLAPYLVHAQVELLTGDRLPMPGLRQGATPMFLAKAARDPAPRRSASG